MISEADKKNSSQNKILTIPNILSFFRLCLIPVFVWLYCWEKNYILTGVILDRVRTDGHCGRHYCQAVQYGQ